VTNSNLIVAFAIVVFQISSLASMSQRAKMAPPTPLVLASLIERLAGVEKTGPLTEPEAQVILLARVGKEVLGLEEIGVSSDEPAQIATALVQAIHKAIHARPNWTDRVSTSQSMILDKKKIELQNAIGTDEYVQAWLQIQWGDRGKAKDILNQAFQSEYKRVKSLERLVTGLSNGGPLDSAEAMAKALQPLQSDFEKSATQDRINELKLHISKLPETRIMT